MFISVCCLFYIILKSQLSFFFFWGRVSLCNSGLLTMYTRLAWNLEIYLVNASLSAQLVLKQNKTGCLTFSWTQHCTTLILDSQHPPNFSVLRLQVWTITPRFQIVGSKTHFSPHLPFLPSLRREVKWLLFSLEAEGEVLAAQVWWPEIVFSAPIQKKLDMETDCNLSARWSSEVFWGCQGLLAS